MRTRRMLSIGWQWGCSVLGAGLIAVAIGLVWVSCTVAWDGGSEMTYSVLPRADYIGWDDKIGLDNTYLYGGGVGANLDRLVTLRGYYLTNTAAQTNLKHISSQFVDQELGISNYGVDVVLNLNQGRLVPFIKCGGGIMRFDPDSGKVFEQIALRAGGGVRYQLAPRICGEVSVEDLFYRIDRTLLSAHDPGEMVASDPNKNKLRSNLAVSAGLSFDLGGYRSEGMRAAGGRAGGLGERFASGVWMVEPFSGRLRFDNPSDLGDHEVVGCCLGVGVSENLNLCGYYWRAMKKGYDATEDLQSYGGEAQFFLARGQGALPYLIMGAGKLDFLSGFEDVEGRTRSDKAVLILGAGVGFAIGDYLRADVSARDYMLSEGDFDEVGSPDQLRHSLAITGGLSFLVGEWWRGGPAGAGQAGEQKPSSYQSDRYVTLPAPTVGEIYVRYGEPGALSVVSGQPAPPVPVAPVPPAPPAPQVQESVAAAPKPEAEVMDRETIRRIVDEELTAALRMPAAPALPETALAGADQTELIARRIADSIEQRLRAGGAAGQPTTIVVERPQEAVPQAPEQIQQPIVVQPETIEIPGERPRLVTVPTRQHIAYTYSGFNVDDPFQWLIGARFDAVPVRRGSSIWLVPEVAFGLFNKGSLMLVANAQYDFNASVSIHGKRITPYMYAGAGLLHFGKGAGRDRNEAVVNLGYGVTFDIHKLQAFVEHQGVDLFSLHRVLFGLRWGTLAAD
jgi:hypothetical protein